MSSQNSLYPGYTYEPATWEGYIIKKDTAFPWSDPVHNEKQPATCKHEWKEIRLVISSVYDCAKCGCKKEDIK